MCVLFRELALASVGGAQCRWGGGRGARLPACGRVQGGALTLRGGATVAGAARDAEQRAKETAPVGWRLDAAATPRLTPRRARTIDGYLVDPASCHMLVSKI